MKRFPVLFVLIGASLSATACVTCNRAVQEAIFNSTYFPNLGTMLSAFFVLASIIASLAWTGRPRHARRVQQIGNKTLLAPVPCLHLPSF